MSVKKINPKLTPVNKITKVTTESQSSTSEGFVFTIPREASDKEIVIIAKDKGSGGTVTLKAPTKGFYAAASADVTETLGANELGIIRIDSAKYANADGTVKVVTSAATIELAVIC